MIFCVVRKKKVAATPEEQVRQGCLSWMIKELGYPPAQIAVEIPLSGLPHLKERNLSIPDRRLDILVYHKNAPWLLIECKAEQIDDKAFRQISGYHHWVGSPYFSLVGKGEARTYYFENQEVKVEKGIPFWQSLIL